MTPKKYPQKEYHFSENPKTYKILTPPNKIAWAYVWRMYKNIRVPPPPFGIECLTLLKIEVIEYEKEGFKMAWNALSDT